MKGKSQHAARGSDRVGSRLVLAGVSYLNSRPILDPLEGAPYSARFAVQRVVPAEVARMLAEDEAALGLIPVAAAATLGDIRFVRGVGIGARGRVRSVLLVSERPLEEIEDVELDLSSRTSVVLAKLLLARIRKSEPRYLGRSYGAGNEPNPRGKTAALIIGDRALGLEGQFPHVLDLGQAWLEWTGLPFVFAAWGARATTDVRSEDAQALRDALDEGLA